MAKAKAKVEEVQKVRVTSNTGGKSEYLKDICMKYSHARTKRQEAVSKVNKVVQKF